MNDNATALARRLTLVPIDEMRALVRRLAELRPTIAIVGRDDKPQNLVDAVLLVGSEL